MRCARAGDLGPQCGEGKTGMSSWHGRNVTGVAQEGGLRESQACGDVNRAEH